MCFMEKAMEASKSAKLPTSARLATYTTLAAAAASAAVGGTADASTVVSTALQGKKINWDTGSGNFAAVSVLALGTAGDAFGGLLGAGGGFKLNTRATAVGGRLTSGFLGVVAVWQGVGTGQFQRGGSGTNPALLANFNATAGAGTAAAAFANLNLGYYSTSSSSFFSLGNNAFSGSSKYLLFSFTGTDTNTYYGWIEILETTVGWNSNNSSNYSATLGRWAYDNQANYQLKAGEINAAAVPGGAGLAALAFGAAGLRGRRRGRN